jgi:hypothetical protein
LGGCERQTEDELPPLLRDLLRELPSEGIAVCLVNVESSYFTAEIFFVLVSSCVPPETLRLAYPTIRSTAQGIIAFVGSEASQSWKAHEEFLSMVLPSTESTSEEEETSLQLNLEGEEEKMLLLLSLASPESPEESLQMQFAADNGLEFLLVDNSADQVDLKRKRSLLEDCQGWERFAECLVTTPWSIMTRKTPKKPSPPVLEEDPQYDSTFEGVLDDGWAPIAPECEKT